MGLNIDKWTFLSLVDEGFIKDVRLVYVYGSQSNTAILVTKNDDVYALGPNSYCLGADAGRDGGNFEPMKVTELCKKKIIGLACGTSPHVLAYTAEGKVFGWGSNGNCALGTNNGGAVSTPTLINVDGKHITMVACGSEHSLALTSDGEIYAWGLNSNGQVGCGIAIQSLNSRCRTPLPQATPRRIETNIGNKRAVSIACSKISSIALMDGGELYWWGNHGGVQNERPCPVAGLNGVVVTQIVCGIDHSMALSDKGDVYTWGRNDCGQLGNGGTGATADANRVETGSERCVRIAAINSNATSAAITETGTVLVWGQWSGQHIVKPRKTRLRSVHEVFAQCAIPCTWTPLEVEHTSCKVMDSLSKSFDDPATCDAKFSVDGQTIHVHKAILKIRCEHLRAMFQNEWAENKMDVIEIKHYSYEVYHAFLKYIYTGRVDSPPEDIIGLLDLANSYCEVELTRISADIVKHEMTVDNATRLYVAAIQYGAKELENFCLRYIVLHMTDIVQTGGFADVEESIVKNFLVEAAREGAFKY